jgi:hypothetical protein
MVAVYVEQSRITLCSILPCTRDQPQDDGKSKKVKSQKPIGTKERRTGTMPLPVPAHYVFVISPQQLRAASTLWVKSINVKSLNSCLSPSLPIGLVKEDDNGPRISQSHRRSQCCTIKNEGDHGRGGQML